MLYIMAGAEGSKMAISTLAGKKCFITGAASGIGQATARAAAHRDAAVFLTDIDEEGLERTVLAIRGRGGQVPLHSAADVRDLEAVELRFDLARHGIGVSLVCPTRIGSRAKIDSFGSSPVVGLALFVLATFAMACSDSETAGTFQTGTSGATDTDMGSSEPAADESGYTTTLADTDEPGSPTDPDDGGTETTDTDGGGSANLDRFVCPGADALTEGINHIQVGDRTRSFYLEFPDHMNGPIGVVFSWHGYNDPGSDGDAAGWRNAAEVDANADPNFPVVVVTPFDVDFDPPVGLDWQLDEGTAEGNIDLAFFEAMVGCLNEQYEIDPAGIYSYGFSAGSVMSSLIHSAYPDVVSAVVCVSGMWFNDPVQVEMINLIPVDPSWPALDSRDPGTVLLTHGGPNDVTVLHIANLENMAQAAFPFLAAAGRVVVDCAHDNGHTLHPELTTEQVMKFFADHRAGAPSPYIDRGLSGYPASCTLRLP